MLSIENFKKFFRPKLDLAMKPEELLRELPGSREVQERSLLHFREYSEKLLTEDLEAFQKEKMSELDSDRHTEIWLNFGEDKTFRGRLAAFLIGREVKEDPSEECSILEELSFLTACALFVALCIFLLILVALFNPLFKVEEAFNLQAALTISLGAPFGLLGLFLLLALADEETTPFARRNYSTSLELESPLPKLLKSIDSLETNKKKNKLNKIFFDDKGFSNLPESKEQVLTRDIYLIIEEHLEEKARELLKKAFIEETPEKINWLTAKELYREDLENNEVPEFFFKKPSEN